MSKILKSLFATIALTAVTHGAQAVVILDTSSAGYYNSGLGTLLDTSSNTSPFPCANVGCGDLTLSFVSAPNLSAAAAPLGTWLTNAAPVGGAWSAAPQAIPGTWTVNSETAIVYAVNAGAGLTNVNLSLGIDNGIFVWLNGSYLFGARAAGGSTLGEYALTLSNLIGMNYLQILREDHGGGTGYAISLSADRVIKVAEPNAIALLGLGLLAFGAASRRMQVRASKANSAR